MHIKKLIYIKYFYYKYELSHCIYTLFEPSFPALGPQLRALRVPAIGLGLQFGHGIFVLHKVSLTSQSLSCAIFDPMSKGISLTLKA